MKRIVMLEALTFGIERLVDAAKARDIELILLTGNRQLYAEAQDALGHDLLLTIDVDTSDQLATESAIRSLGSIDGILSNTDTWMVMAASLSERLSLPGMLPEMALNLRDKSWVRSKLEPLGLAQGIAALMTKNMHHQLAQFPRIVKPASGTGSRGVYVVNDYRTHAALMERLHSGALMDQENYISEPYLCGPLYSAEVYTLHGMTSLLGVSSRILSDEPEFREIAFAYPHRHGSPWERMVAEWSTKVVAALGTRDGLCHIEFIVTPGGPFVVEVNSRLGGGLIGESIMSVNGFDPYDALLGIAVGAPPIYEKSVQGPVSGFGQVKRYASRAGTLGAVSGFERFPSFPGKPKWHPTKQKGARISSISDQGGCYGYVSATGENAEEAFDNAGAAGRIVTAEMV